LRVAHDDDPSGLPSAAGQYLGLQHHRMPQARERSIDAVKIGRED